MQLSKPIKIFLLISLILFLQLGIFPHITILGIYPNLILITILSFSILKGFKPLVIWILIAGLFLDFYSLNNVFGISVIGLLFASFLALFLSQNIFKKTNLLSASSVFFITIALFNLLLLILYKIFNVSLEDNFVKVLITIIYNSLIAVPVFYLIKKIFPRVKTRI